MRFITLPLLAATAVFVAGSPINGTVTANATVTIDPTCSSKMDGKLPYYQPTGFNFSGNIRRYYIAAEIDTWDYAPTGTPPPPFLLPNPI
jgi:hypothetical protein